MSTTARVSDLKLREKRRGAVVLRGQFARELRHHPGRRPGWADRYAEWQRVPTQGWRVRPAAKKCLRSEARTVGGCEGEAVSRPPSCECRPRSPALLSSCLSWLTRAKRALRRARSQQPRYGAVRRTVPRPPAAGREVRNRGVREDDLRVRSTACRARSVRCARAEGDRAAVLVAVARSSRLDI